MANVEKFNMSAVGHVCAHFAREADNYSNENIDEDLTWTNYNLAPDREVSQVEFVKKMLDEIPHAKRKDLCVMSSWCVTAPKTLPATQHERFFQLTYDFLVERYGSRSGLSESVCVSAYVHHDETTPHMHFAFLPVVQTADGSQRFCAKECVNRRDLKTFHSDYKNYLMNHGMYADVNEGTTLLNSNGKALTVKELKKVHELEHEHAVERRLRF